MAEVPQYEAYITLGDQQKRLTTVSVRVDAIDGKAFVAAADTATRSASKVGLLLIAIETLTKGAPDAIKGRGLNSFFLNDAFAYPAVGTDTLNSNKWNVHYSTLNGGIPENRQFTIPQRFKGDGTIESNGENLSLTAGADVPDLVAQIADTMLSIFGTAATVTEIDMNDQ